MAVGCGAKCAKVMLIVFNFIFWLSGAALLGIGIWLRVDKNILEILKLISLDQSDPMLDYAAYVIIGVGAFVFLVGFFGCCGAIKENKCLLGLYIFFLVIVMAGEIAAGVITIIYKDKVTSEFKDQLREQVEKEYQPNNTFAVSIDFAQIYFKCCGVDEAADWEKSAYFNITRHRVPFSCCIRKQDSASKDALDIKPSDLEACTGTDDKTNKDGCDKAIQEWFSSHAIILIGIGIGIACLEIFGFIFAICLCRNIGSEDD